jgi:signal transduction histidine kinase
VKQYKSVARAERAAEPLAPLDGIRLEQFLDLQQSLLALPADPDTLPPDLAQRIALFLRLPVALGAVEDGRYHLIASHGVGETYGARYHDRVPEETPLGLALTTGRPLVLPEPGDQGATLVLPFGSERGRPAGALHLLLPRDVPVADDTLALARALAALAGLALGNARHGRRLARLSRLKGDSLSAMAHDLRAPLNALVGYASLLGDGTFGPLTDQQREIAAILERQAIELTDLLGATLDVARIESGQLPIRRDEFALADLAAALGGGTFARPSREGLLLWHLAGDLPRLHTDRVKVKEIVQNLVDNALKHRGDAPVEVEMSAAPHTAAVRITVRDRGPGVRPDVLPHLFEPFRAGDARGTGFGLYIVRCFVEALGGRVAARSEPGVGTAVTVELPLAAPTRSS